MNCTIRKTKNASVASSFGRISGMKVFVKPSCEKMMYCGTITTWIGNMIVSSMIAKKPDLPLNCRRAKA